MTVEQGKIREVSAFPARHIGGMSAATKKATEEANKWIVCDDPSKELLTTVRTLVAKQGQRLFDNVRFMSLYGNRDFLAPHYSGQQPFSPMPRMADNQLKKQCDTTVGKLVQSNSRISMMVDQGNFHLWNKARKMESAIAGEWARMDIYRELQKIAIDGMVTGTGWLKMGMREDGKAMECQRIFPNEMFVDDLEAAYGQLLKLYQMRYVSKDALIAAFPDKAPIINSANSAIPPQFPWCQFSKGMVEIVEAWALPVGDRPGRHVIAVDGGCIVDEEYKDKDFPFVIFKPNDAPLGFYGQGWVEQTMAAQILLNKMLNVMEQGAHYGVAPFWVVSQGAEINQKHLDNVVGHIVETTGSDPKWVTNAPFHAAAPAYCDMLRTVISDFWGNNSMDTGGEPPINRIDSKKALREYQDMGASRVTTLIERWTNDVFIDCARRTLMIARQIAKKNGGYPVLVQDTFKKAVQLNWADLDLDEDSYLLRPAPANMLSNTPAGKLDDIKELLAAGIIDQKKAQMAMQSAMDINALIGESTATEADLDWVIEQIIEHDNYIPPDSIQDLQRGLVRMADAKLQYRTMGLPEDKLALFDQWLEDAQDVLQDATAQNAPPQVAVQAAPQPGVMPNAGIPSDPAGNPATGNIGAPSPDPSAAPAAPVGPG